MGFHTGFYLAQSVLPSYMQCPVCFGMTDRSSSKTEIISQSAGSFELLLTYIK